MNMTTVEIKTSDGMAPCDFFAPPQVDRRPAIIFFMDAIGIRPALRDMAARLASEGYYVLLPNLYYRNGSTETFDAAAIFQEGPARKRLLALAGSLTNQMVAADTACFLDFLQQQPHVAGRNFGCVGYCMAARFVLTAAGRFPDRITAAAGIHGTRLATDQPDSPHLLAPHMRAAVYIGIAEIDPHFPPEEKQRLEAAFQAAGVKHTVEVYPGVKHGFAVNDTPVYDRTASERHWQQILKLFQENLSVPESG